MHPVDEFINSFGARLSPKEPNGVKRKRIRANMEPSWRDPVPNECGSCEAKIRNASFTR